jgi:Family of unknown function (DUF5522)
MKGNSSSDPLPARNSLVEDEDFYFEDGLMVLTEKYLLKRGYCCENGCRHCPYQIDLKVETLQAHSE